MNHCVLDTTIASMLLNQSPLLAPYYLHLLNFSWFISFQTVAEMKFGAHQANWGERRRQKLEQFFGSLHIVGYDDDLAQCWAEIKYDAQKAGRRLEAGDAWIAATAKYLNAPLLTHDKDFSPQACSSITVYCYTI